MSLTAYQALEIVNYNNKNFLVIADYIDNKIIQKSKLSKTNLTLYTNKLNITSELIEDIMIDLKNRGFIVKPLYYNFEYYKQYGSIFKGLYISWKTINKND